MELIFSFEDGSEALAHYGVKGMRWGHRKNNAESYQDRKNGFSKENLVYSKAAYRARQKHLKYADKAAKAKSDRLKRAFSRKSLAGATEETDRIALDNPKNAALRAYAGPNPAIRLGKKNETRTFIARSIAIGMAAGAASVASLSVPAASVLGAVSLGTVAISEILSRRTGKKVSAYTRAVLDDVRNEAK